MLRTRLIAGSASGLVLSAIFAAAMTVVNVGETWIDSLRVIPGQPAPVSLRVPPITVREAETPGGSAILRTIAPIVGRGEIIRDPKLASVVAVYEHGRRPPRAGYVIGIFSLFFLTALLITSYLRAFIPSRGALLRTQAGLLGLIASLLIIAKTVLLFTSLM